MTMGEKHKWTSEEVQFWYRGRKSQNYCNPEDTNWVVRKPRSLGWTMNLANKKTWWFLAGVACVMLLIVTVQKNWNRSIGIIGGADGPTVIYVSDKKESQTPTGYPSDSVQRPQIMYDGAIYLYGGSGFDGSLPQGCVQVGSVQTVDNANAPAEDFAGSRVEAGQKIYALPGNSGSIYVEYTDGFAEFLLTGASK